MTKLRSILLLEADLNKANKIIYGDRMMKSTYIGRQLRTPSAIASIDASNCYDRIAHAIASLVFQAFGVEQTATESMLTTIQEMKYFLRTQNGIRRFESVCTQHGRSQIPRSLPREWS